jgi:hypothetical protein
MNRDRVWRIIFLVRYNAGVLTWGWSRIQKKRRDIAQARKAHRLATRRGEIRGRVLDTIHRPLLDSSPGAKLGQKLSTIRSVGHVLGTKTASACQRARNIRDLGVFVTDS